MTTLVQCGGRVRPDCFARESPHYSRNRLLMLDAWPAAARFEPHPLAGNETLHRGVAQSDFAPIVNADHELVDGLGPDRVLEDVRQQFQDRHLAHALHGAELAEVELLRRVVRCVSRGQRAGEDEDGGEFLHAPTVYGRVVAAVAARALGITADTGRPDKT